MKKIITVVLAMILVAAMIAPAFAADSPTDVLHVATKANMPNATAEDAPNFVYVEDEGVMYVKSEDYLGEVSYVPEDEAPIIYELTGTKTWTKGKDGDETFTSNADFAKFVAVYVDKALVDAANYDAASGSTDVTLHKDYLETLELGEHELVILSNDGYAKGTFTVVEEGQSGNGGEQTPDTHQTGDNSNTFMWVAISLVSLGAIGVVAFALAKKRKSAEN